MASDFEFAGLVHHLSASNSAARIRSYARTENRSNAVRVCKRGSASRRYISVLRNAISSSSLLSSTSTYQDRGLPSPFVEEDRDVLVAEDLLDASRSPARCKRSVTRSGSLRTE